MNKFIIKTLGCKTNQIESAIIEEKLIEAGFVLEKSIEESNFYILNSCSVTDNADCKALSLLRSVKKQNPSIKTILTGCFAQLEHKSLAKKIEIDFLVGNNEKLDIPKIIELKSKICVSDIFDSKKFNYQKLKSIHKTRAIVKIQDGCNNRCSYCTIPLARGINRSNSIKNIIEQITVLEENGFDEVVFTGIHIGQWGQDLAPCLSLIDLLKEVEKTKITRYRLGSLNPLELNDNLLNFLSVSDKFCPHFHMSLQSGCDKILAAMNRMYSYEFSLEIIEKINKLFEDPFIGSDIIVGFPGENNNDFEETYSNLSKTNLSQIHVFPYSKRKNTKAYDMTNQVPENLKKERVSKIKEISDIKHQLFLQKNIGKTLEIIVEDRKDKNSGLYKGVSRNYINILVAGMPVSDNKLQKVNILSLSKDAKKLIGKFIN